MSRLLRAILAIAAFTVATPSFAANYTVKGNRLIVSGTMTSDHEFATFSRHLRDNPTVDTIVMKDFLGGSVSAGSFITIPQFIRDKKLKTEVDGACASACALAFLGGVRRSLAPGADPDRTFVAFHGIYLGDGRRSESDRGAFMKALRRFSDGKMPAIVGEVAYALPMRGLVLFYDGRKLKKNKGISVLVCKDAGKADTCTPISDVDSVKAGVFTR